MKKLTFSGGIHPPYNKHHSRHLQIEELDAPELMIYPVTQHIGAPAKPVVAVGDSVRVGQLIAEAGGFVSANIHSSVSGTVTAIKPCLHPNGTEVNSIVVQNDFLYTADSSLKCGKTIEQLSPKEIVNIVREAGIVGMGGATFPTHVKLSPPEDKKIDTVIVNGAECEPYLTSDHRVMLESTSDVLYGLKACMKALGVTDGVVAIEDNKPDAFEAMEETAKLYSGVRVASLKTKYPQGSEKHIIKAVTGREVPPGALPADVGVVVVNIDTANAIANAIKNGMPLISRIVTVGGDAIANCRNYRVRTGTPISHVIASAGGFTTEPEKLILGGPMMGIAVFSQEVPIIKGTGAILALTQSVVSQTPESKCMRCGKCVEACPMNLQPLLLGAYSRKEDFDTLEKLNIMDCIECGACSFLCPGHRNPLQHIRVAKAKMRKAKTTK